MNFYVRKKQISPSSVPKRTTYIRRKTDISFKELQKGGIVEFAKNKSLATTERVKIFFY